MSWENRPRPRVALLVAVVGILIIFFPSFATFLSPLNRLWLQFGLFVAFVVGITVWLLPFHADRVRDLVSRFRSRHERERLLEDPAYRLRMATVATYTELLQEMIVARACSDERPGNDARRQRFVDARAAVAAFLVALEGPYLEAVVAYLHDDLLDRRVPIGDVRTWLEGECRCVRQSPYAAMNHLLRFINDFSEPPDRTADE